MDTMKAVVFKEKGRIAVEETPTPRPKAGDAVIRITATTICGTDVHIVRGEYPVCARRHPGGLRAVQRAARRRAEGGAASRTGAHARWKSDSNRSYRPAVLIESWSAGRAVSAATTRRSRREAPCGPF